MQFASIIILSYKRPQMLIDCINSIHQTLDFPAEIIVNDDGGLNYSILQQFLLDKKISKLILNAGHNRGVGRSFQNGIGVSEGDFIIKCDSDLIFKPNWLSTAIKILENNRDIGTLSLFDYRNYDYEDKRFNHIEERKDCFIVDDFVSSIYVGRRIDFETYLENMGIMPDDGAHLEIGHMPTDYEFRFPRYIAITKHDYINNTGFGEKSVYLTKDSDGTFHKTETFDTPFLILPS